MNVMKTMTGLVAATAVMAVVMVACSGKPVPPPDLPSPEYEPPRAASSAAGANASAELAGEMPPSPPASASAPTGH